MALRISGITSGLDTDYIIAELVKVESTKVETLEKEQTLLQWTQDAWQSLNAKIYNFYNTTLTQMRNASTYQKVVSTSSNESVLKVSAGTSTTNGVQSAYVTSLAQAGYLTGGQLETSSDGTNPSGSTLLSDIDGMDELTGSFYVKSSTTATPMEIKIDETTTMDDLVSQLNKAGVTANYDEANGRLFISSSKTGEDNEFSFTDEHGNAVETGTEGANLLQALKLEGSSETRIAAQDATLVLNGATFTSSTNTFTINGMSFTATGISEKDTDGNYVSTTITTETDYDGIYDLVKNLISEYNSLVNEMDALYNADSASGYEPLTDEEKDSISESEAEEIEELIKASLLSNDSTVNSVMNSMYSVMIQGIESTTTGETMYLSDFGIATLGYFNSAENEKHAFYIDGDSSSASTSANTDKLMSAIVSDPETVIDFFTQLSQAIWKSLDEKMQSTDFSSIYKVYNDKQMDTEYADYTTAIAEAEAKLTEYEDRWYEKFTAMEVALAELQSKESAIASLLSM